ncbi:DUF1206 domain-containing protein [Rhodocytophaga rosea]|uniref:DUF1206 domain-containing protein n=1 Tax=Rhodocytophaga rosea TaxID=2704465 RepID=A0A6C0GFY5_9BACT|nr:DUF1206 domain-containing protein [Rhodocytophaga rosea]QHT66819.1 DUF1206 domain-containing protein [Rhodocytophaga rosea]
MANYSLSTSHIGHESQEWIKKLARFGFVAKGIIYVLLGIMAVMAAIGQGSTQEASKNGVAQLIFEQPFGRVLAILLVIGLAGYVIWRFVEAIMDPQGSGSDSKGMVKRIGYFISGLLYTGFAVSIIKQLIGSGGGSSNSQQTWTAKLLEMEAGPFILIVIGLIIVASGIAQFIKAYKAKFKKHLRLEGVQTETRKWITRIGKIGFTARGIVWLIVGYFIIRAGMQSDASEVQGSQGAFSFLQQMSYGHWILLVVAIGVTAYGVFQFVKARYYQINLH